MEQSVEALGPAAVMDRESPTAGEIAAFLDGRLEGAELSRVQGILAADPAARQELIKASRIVASAPSTREPKRSWVPAFATLAAAAAIAIVLIPARNLSRESAPVAAERRAPADDPPKIQVVVPAEGSPVRNDDHPFTWRGVDGASYRVIVSDVAGNTVLQKNTTDTVLAIPESLLANEGATYYFAVYALLPDGSSLGSGAHEFVVSPR
jgi:anti-sigma factor RsiW